MGAPLIILRAIHFASSVVLAGTMVFGILVAGPVLPRAGVDSSLSRWRGQLTRIAWISLAIAVVSGAAWLVVLAANIGRWPLSTVLADDMIWSVLMRTRFGTDWSVRFFLALMLALGLIAIGRHRDAVPRWLNAILATLAVSLLGTLAWAGHASGTPGIAGDVHVTADVLHLVAVGVWIGGLVPYALLLASARRVADSADMDVARDATLRFSTLGLVAVGTILATGSVNTYVLVGSMSALLATDYGRLLLVKIILFTAMVCIAAFNRLSLTPQLSNVRAAAESRRQLQRNSLIEVGLGLLILLIVGALGTLPPGLHAMPSTHAHGT
jgi:putative copper resistance protein D